jgi:hypothetical protein
MPSAVFEPTTGVADEVEALYRAWRASAPGEPEGARVPQKTQLTIDRSSAHDFRDRQVYLYVDGEKLGKVRYGEPFTHEVAPGRHVVRVFNTLVSDKMTIDVAPGEHVRLRCTNGMPTAGWLMMVFLKVTYLTVRLERM